MKTLENRGISLIVLIVTIAVILILVGTVTITGADAINTSKKMEFATEIAFLQEDVQNYKQTNNSYPITGDYNFDVTNLSSGELLQFNEEQIVDGKISLHIVDIELLGNYDFKYGKKRSNTDVYLVSNITGKIYYLSGLHIGDMRYFTLNDELKNIIKYTDYTASISDKSKVTFEYNSSGYTNIPVELKVYVPSSYQDITVTIKPKSENGYDILYNLLENNMYIYRVTGLALNYDVIVNYKVNSNDTIYEQESFSVNNFDNIAPIFSISDIKTLVNTQTNEVNRYIDIVEKSDDLSGIKSIKYENRRIEVDEIESYFNTKGIAVKDNMNIPILDDVEVITIVIIDNAQNYGYLYLEL